MRITDDEKQRIIELKCAEGEIFNLDALRRKFSPVFIVEDAGTAKLLAMQGYAAIGLEDPVNEAVICNLVKGLPACPAVVLSLPYKAGYDTAACKIMAELDGKGFKYAAMDAEGGEFIGAGTEARTEELIEKALSLLKQDFARENNVAEHIADFLAEVNAFKSNPAVKTGFADFDMLLGGGLYPGLYTIGAEPGTGKTSFVMQIADHIAAAGKDVFVYSVEMSRNELFARSVSRMTFEKSQNPGRDLQAKLKFARLDKTKLRKSAHDVMDGSRHERFTDIEQDVIIDCIAEYGEQSKTLYVIESYTGKTAADIEQDVIAWKQITGSAPVVIVDYLQILAPINDRGTDKQNADAAVKTLKNIARVQKAPVIAISSLNRSSYDEENGDSGFKETGGIEYTADVTIRLYLPEVLEAMKGQTGKENKARAKAEKKSEILQEGKRTVGAKIYKSRFEKPYGAALFDFYGAYSCFVPQNGGGLNGLQDATPAQQQEIFEPGGLFGKVEPKKNNRRV